MNVAIIGSSGFIGTNLFRYLYDNTDYNFLLMDRAKKEYSQEEKESNRISLNFSNIETETHVSNILRYHDFCPDILINLASTSCVDESIREPGIVIQNNVNLMVSVLHAVKTLKVPLLHISSDEQYGPKTIEEQFDGHYNPSNPYSASKTMQEMMVKAYRNTYGIKAAILTLTNQFGPYQTFNKVTPIIIKCINEGTPIPLYCNDHGISNGYRLWRYVGDTVKHIHNIIKRGDMMLPVNFLLGGIQFDNLQYIDIISQLIGKPFTLNRLNGAVARPGHDIGYKLGLDGSNRYKVEQFLEDMKTTIKHYTS